MQYDSRSAFKTYLGVGPLSIVLVSGLIVLSSGIITAATSVSGTDISAQSSIGKKLTGPSSGNPPSAENLGLPSGYMIEAVVWNLTAPDSVTFDNKGNMYVAEAGFPFTKLPSAPRILKVDSQTGNISIFADIGFNAPIVDIVFNEKDGLIYVANRDKISTVDANGSVKDIIVGLPANGDHHVNQIAFSPDGKRLYFGIGTSTNSGVVGGADPDNLAWLPSLPFVHDVPGMDITLAGKNFEDVNPLTAENDTAMTGAFVPFDTRTTGGQIIKGNEKCSGCILSYNIDGTGQKLEGWGFRNPDGLAFNNEGRLFATVHGIDERGIRPVANDSDKFYEVKLNETTPAWHGWPDYAGNAEPVTDPKFKSARSNQSLGFLMADHPNVEKPLALFEPAHTAAMQLAFADEQFGFAGEAFVPEQGTYAPKTEPPPAPGTIVGHDVVRVNVDTGNITKFLTLKEPSDKFRPTDVLFRSEGGGTSAMYLVDWGTLLFPGAITIENTGVVWKIMKTATAGGGGSQASAAAESPPQAEKASNDVVSNTSAAASSTSATMVSIVKGAADPGNQKFFEPPEIRVSTGATVTWTNNDMIQHTVTSGTPSSGPSGQFDSGIIEANGKFSHTFSSPGTVDYYCTLHPWMTGRVTVG